ncbi:choline/ethanolamine kinase [Glonium stellatum]|uniref:Choline/ethanolamine kinase n=1 Tax=Glonium stellatum TaxID=574774 RepID=A0A8E2JVM2_9PEZI|nr:choline/ethanolamine kinase [Glonium stellatum]
MVMLTPVSVTLPDSKVPTKNMIRGIVATFLTKEWPSMDPETLTASYHAASANGYCPVERLKLTTGIPTELLKVFMQFHKVTGVDMEIFKHPVPNKQEEALFCHEYGRSGLGAKVYGFFKTQDGTLGRVDEFLDARNMELEDVENAVIRADVARGLAMFHAMETSLEKKAVEPFYEAAMNGLRKYHNIDKLKALGKEGGVSVNNLINYDFAVRLEKVVDKLESVGGKTGWCIHDVHFMNVLVKNDPKERENKIVLVDFELKMFKWFDEESKIADYRKYTEEERRHFCEEYARQWNKLTGNLDTRDQVFVESEYGYMLAITFDVHNMLCFMAEEDDKDPLNLLGLNKLFDEFVDQYAKLGLEVS